MPSGVLGDAVVPITEVGWEVAVAEQVAHHRHLMSPHLQMVCSRLDMFWVALVPWYRRK